MSNLEELKRKYPISEEIPQKDLRDYKYALIDPTSRKHKREYEDIDLDIDLPNYMQGDVGACQGCSLAFLMSYSKNTASNLNDMMSEGFIYGYRPEGYNQNVGLNTNNGFNTAVKIGNVKHKDFPVLKNYPAIKQDLEQYGINKLLEKAADYKMEAYVSVEADELKEFIHNYKNPCNMVILCYENFYDCLETGEFPREGEGKCIGAHAVVAKGQVNGKIHCINWWKGRRDYWIDADSPTIVSLHGFTDKQSVKEQATRSYGWEKVNPKTPADKIKWKYVKEDGSYAKSEWIKVYDKWYYIDCSEFAIDGDWVFLKGIWYYLKPNSCEMAVGWEYINSNWYYFDNDGHMLKGWQYIDGEWFYLRDVKESDDKPEGSMFTGWKISQDCSKWYYLNEKHTDKFDKGVCVHDCTLNIDGKTYSFNSDGAMQEFVRLVTREQLNQVGWYNKYITDSMLADLNNCLQRFNITTPARIRHFISQCSHESGCGYYMVEEASGRAYEYRKDLGNIYSGDGVKYKGAGYIQLTGRANYQSLANYLGDQNVMQGANYVANNYPWTSAGYWWYKNNMNSLCDNGSDCLAITKRVNGGTNGYQDRLMYYDKCCNIF